MKSFVYPYELTEQVLAAQTLCAAAAGCPDLAPEDFLAEAVFFDIETTGLSPEISSVYLISVLTFESGQGTVTQWFADDYHSEAAVLAAFGELLSKKRFLLHYNGTGFDLPYLTRKWQAAGMPYSFDSCISLDFYKLLGTCRKKLPLENLKLVTVEAFLGIRRLDPYNGGELISVYGDYLKRRICHQEGAEDLLASLLLHNREDVTALPEIAPLLSVPALFDGRIHQAAVTRSGQECRISFRPEAPLPAKGMLHADRYALSFAGEDCLLQVPLFSGTLRHFFADYREYFYLPEEDEAIHKSVGTFVDPAHRRKATAATCYTRKEGLFLPLPKADRAAFGGYPLFFTSYKTEPAYLEFTENFPADAYVKAILKAF